MQAQMQVALPLHLGTPSAAGSDSDARPVPLLCAVAGVSRVARAAVALAVSVTQVRTWKSVARPCGQCSPNSRSY